YDDMSRVRAAVQTTVTDHYSTGLNITLNTAVSRSTDTSLAPITYIDQTLLTNILSNSNWETVLTVLMSMKIDTGGELVVRDSDYTLGTHFTMCTVSEQDVLYDRWLHLGKGLPLDWMGLDSIDRRILLDKLVAIGVRGTALAWFSSYFKERRQVVSICGHNSDEQTVDYGTGDQPDLDPSSSPGARHITVLCTWSKLYRLFCLIRQYYLLSPSSHN
ncbi:hypothetical protein J6590_008858, partial [Homalodisca vitripennis]